MYRQTERDSNLGRTATHAREKSLLPVLCLLAVSGCIDASFFRKGTSHREEPSLRGGSDELSLQLLFIIINFVISTTKQNMLLTLIIALKKSCWKAPLAAPRCCSISPKYSVRSTHSSPPNLSCFGGCSHQLTRIKNAEHFGRFTGNHILKTRDWKCSKCSSNSMQCASDKTSGC